MECGDKLVCRTDDGERTTVATYSLTFAGRDVIETELEKRYADKGEKKPEKESVIVNMQPVKDAAPAEDPNFSEVNL